MLDIQKAAISAQIPEASSIVLDTLPIRRDQDENVTASLDKELEDAGKEVTSSMKERQRQMLDSLDLKKLGHLFLIPPFCCYYHSYFLYLDMRSMMLVQIGV